MPKTCLVRSLVSVSSETVLSEVKNKKYSLNEVTSHEVIMLLLRAIDHLTKTSVSDKRELPSSCIYVRQ